MRVATALLHEMSDGVTDLDRLEITTTEDVALTRDPVTNHPNAPFTCQRQGVGADNRLAVLRQPNLATHACDLIVLTRFPEQLERPDLSLLAERLAVDPLDELPNEGQSGPRSQGNHGDAAELPTSSPLFVFVGIASAHPLVDLGELELPEATDLVGRQPAVLDPSVDGVLRNPEVRGNVIDRDLRLCHRLCSVRGRGFAHWGTVPQA